jgi:putative transposase
LQYHLILTPKFRRPVFTDVEITNAVKLYSKEIFDILGVVILEMEVDKDHIHFCIETPIDINIKEIIRNVKSYICKNCYLDLSTKQKLRKYYWYSNYLFSSGAFISTVGINLEIIKNYVKSQGK